MSDLTSLQEAEALVVGLSRAVDQLRLWRPPILREGSVEYRYDTAIAILDIMVNDAKQMQRQWEEELDG